MDAKLLRTLSAEAGVDPRTFARYLIGVSVRRMASERIQAVLNAHKIGAYSIPSESSSIAAQELSGGHDSGNRDKA